MAALRQLQQRYKLVVISNIDDGLFAQTQKHLGVEFDEVITAQRARSYKPFLNNFQIALRTLAISPAQRRAGAVAGYLDGVGEPEVSATGDWRGKSLDRATRL